MPEQHDHAITPLGAGDLAADPAALKEAADGLVAAMGELKSVSGAVNGELGRGFDELALSGMQLGNEELRSAFARFGERWDWGVRVLLTEGNELAGRLGLSAGAFHDNEQYVKGTFKDLAVGFTGDPDETDTDAENHSLAWSRRLTGAPDESGAQADQHIAATAKATAADEIRSSPDGSILDRLSGGALSRDTAGWQRPGGGG